MNLSKKNISILIIASLYIAGSYLYQDMTAIKWWQVATNGEMYAPPSYANNRIYIGNNESEVKAINVRNGQVEWQNQLEREIQTELVTYKDKAYILTQSGILHCVSQNSGKEFWNFSTNNQYFLNTKPLILQSLIFIGSTDGSIYALEPETGKQVWKFDSNPVTYLHDITGNYSLNWFGSLDTDGKNLFYSSRDGFLYSLNPTNGKVIWKYSLNIPNQSMFIIQKREIVVGGATGEIQIINKNNGHLVQKFQVDRSSIQCIDADPLYGFLDAFPLINSFLTLFSHPLSITTSTGKIYSISADRKNLSQTYDLQSSLYSCPIHINQTKYFLDKSGTLTAYDTRNKSIRWQQKSKYSPTFSPIVFNRLSMMSNLPLMNVLPFGNVLLYGDSEGNLQAFLARSGKVLWSYKNAGSVKSQPIVYKKNLFFTDNAGRLTTIHALNGKAPIPLESKQLSINQESISLGETIYTEFTLNFDHSLLPNPWNQIKIEGNFYQPESNLNLTVNAFYYDLNTWKIRFNPPRQGNWIWQITFRLPDQREIIRQGTLTSSTDTSKTYLKISESNQKFTLDNKTQFYPLGFQDMVVDINSNGTILDDWSLNTNESSEYTASFSGNLSSFRSDKIVSVDDYLQAFSSHGKVFNLFRFGVNNASFSIFDTRNINYRLLVQENKALDAFFSKLKNNSVHLWLSLFSFSIPYNDTMRLSEIQLLKDYTNYIVARYGVFTDVWEIANEAYVSDQLTSTIAATIRASDFENRPITISWEKPQHKDIDIVSLHEYQSDDYKSADHHIQNSIEPFKAHGKPIVFSEYGNHTMSWDPHSNDRMRIKNWTAFFKNTSLIYWNQFNKTYYSKQFNNANIYLGNEERLSIATLNSITQNIPLDAKSMTPPVSDKTVRAYGLESSAGKIGYFVCTQMTASTRTFHTPLTITQKGTFSWINPATGEVLETISVSPGSYNLKSPYCSIDLSYHLDYVTRDEKH